MQIVPTKIVCVGRNYRAHARELGQDVPGEPLLFLKPPSSVIASGAPIVLPRASAQVEFEGEIGIVMGARLRYARPLDAEKAVAGVVALNDVTARDLQRRDGQWTRAKGFDSFCPVADAPVPVNDLEMLTVITRVNGVERQMGSAADMVFSIPELLAYISRIMTLEPGDLVATGTPAGVGPLAEGDEVEVEIHGVSRVQNPVIIEQEIAS
ncbi:MAG TPA: fumarylacetoacetate hydrolase family protein [Gemmatimonadaceae bacterium]|nr:fumarylacetoacetate hydrolase family protein [Gemmatimonadaceae bacterium]